MGKHEFIGIDLASGPDWTVVECPRCQRIHSFSTPTPVQCPKCRSHYNWAGLTVVRGTASSEKAKRWEQFRSWLMSGRKLQFVSGKKIDALPSLRSEAAAEAPISAESATPNPPPEVSI